MLIAQNSHGRCGFWFRFMEKACAKESECFGADDVTGISVFFLERGFSHDKRERDLLVVL